MVSAVVPSGYWAAVARAGLLASLGLTAAAFGANWDGDNPVGNFSYNNNWYGDSPPATGWGTSLYFSYRNNTSQTSLYYDWAWVNFDNIQWDSTFGAGLTLNGNGNGINFNQKIENYSSYAQTVNIPLSGAKNGASQIELNPVNGDLILNGAIYNDNSKPYVVYGNNGKTLSVNVTLGAPTPSAVSLTLAENSIVQLGAAQTYTGDTTIKAGRLEITSAGSVAGAIKLGDTTGSAAAELRLTDSDGGFTEDAAITVNSGSSGTKTISSTNSSGTNTLSGTVTLNNAVTINPSNSGGTLSLTNVISGANAVTKVGAGTLALSGTNTFSGTLTVQEGTLSIGTINNTSANGVLGNNNNAVVLGGSGTTGTLKYTGSTASSTKKFTMATGGGGSFDVSTGATVLTLSGAIDGGGSLTKAGGGTLILTGANTYSGTTTISGGTLQIGNGSTGALGGGAVTNNGVLVIDRSNAYEVSNAISGTGSVTKSASGAITFSGGNSYQGGTTVVAGQINVNHATALGTGTLTIDGAFTLDNTSAGAITLTNNNAIVWNTGAVTFGGTRDLNLGTGTLTINGNRTLKPTNTSSGVLTIGGALNNTATSGTQTITIGGTGADGSVVWSGVISNGTSGGTTAIAITNTNETVTLSGPNTFSGGASLDAGSLILGNKAALGTGSVNFNGGTNSFVVSANTPLTGANKITNAYTLTGTQSVSFAGSNSIEFSGSGSLMTSDRIVANNMTGGATATLSGPLALASGSGSNKLTVNGTGDTIISGTISNGGTSTAGLVTYAGTGSLTLSGTNSYGGVTTVSTGTLVIGANAPSGSNGALGNATSEVVLGTAGGSTNASILTNGAYTVGRAIRIPTNNTTDAGTRVLTLGGSTAANSEFSGNITLGTDLQAGRGVTLTAASGGQVTFSGTIQDPATMDATSYTVTKSGSGTVVMSGPNTYTGSTAVSTGVLNVRHATALGSTTNGTSVTSGAALEIQGGIAVGAEPLTLNGSGVSSGGALRNVSGNNSWAGAITLGSATRIQSDSGTLTMDVASGNAISGTNQNVTFGGSGDMAVADPIATGAGTLTKEGSGSLTLSGTNSYTGNTTVSGGLLAIAAAGSLSTSSAINLASGGDLRFNSSSNAGPVSITGNGSVLSGSGTGRLGNVTFNVTSGTGTLSPGNSIGTLLTSNLTMDANTETIMEIAKIGLNLSSDLLSGAGSSAITFGGTLRLAFDATHTTGLAVNDTFTLFSGYDFAGSSSTFAVLDLVSPGVGLSWDTSGLYSTGTLTVIPESSTGLLAALGGLALIRRRRAA